MTNNTSNTNYDQAVEIIIELINAYTAATKTGSHPNNFLTTETMDFIEEIEQSYDCLFENYFLLTAPPDEMSDARALVYELEEAEINYMKKKNYTADIPA